MAYSLDAAAVPPFPDDAGELGLSHAGGFARGRSAGAAPPPKYYQSITIHGGMKNLDFILDKPVTSNKVSDMFCRDFDKDFDSTMLQEMEASVLVCESDYLRVRKSGK